jgi:hypothetical protein
MDREIDKQDPSSTEGWQVKVGDKLILRHDRRSEVLIVDSVTKTGRIRAGSYEFNQDLTGRGGLRYERAKIATPEDIERVDLERKITKARNGLYDIVWWKVPDSVVLATAEAYGLAMEKHNKGIEVQGE